MIGVKQKRASVSQLAIDILAAVPKPPESLDLIMLQKDMGVCWEAMVVAIEELQAKWRVRFDRRLKKLTIGERDYDRAYIYAYARSSN
jgi:hypothetical protein